MSGSVLALVLSAFQIAQLPQFARITFNVPIDAEHGGGTAIGAAGKVEFAREDYVVASGGVSLRYRAMEVEADRVEVDLKTNLALATGNVVLDEGPRRLAGDRLEYDLETKTGTIYTARGYVSPDLYFYGNEIRKTGEDTYEVRDGVITSCDDDVPDWSFRLSRATVRVEGFARVYNTRMRVKKMPFLYTPFMMFPAKSERASGFLMPNLGYSDNQGFVGGAAYFQTMGPSWDTTLYADYYAGGEFRDEAFNGFGTELRYAPSEVTRGTFRGYLIQDPGLIDPVDGTVVVDEGSRWKIDWAHQSDDLPGRMRLVVNHADFSDFDFFRDFSRNFDDITVRQIQSSAFLSGSWGKHLFSALGETREAFLGGGNTIERRQVPEIQYRLTQTQIGNAPLYLSLLSSVNYFQILPTAGEELDYARADLLPQLTLPVPTPPWLSLSLVAAGRGTYWTDSRVDPDTPPPPPPPEGEEEEPASPYTGETLTRTFGSGRAELVGPSISKVFHKGLGTFGKFKHIVEPRFVYDYRSEFEDQDLVIAFDEVDSSPAGTELVTASLINRLLAKPRDESSPYGAREIMSFELAQSFSLLEDQPLQSFPNPDDPENPLVKTEGPIRGSFRFNPSLYTSVDASATYNTLFSNLNSANLSARTRFTEAATLGLSWVWTFQPDTGESAGEQVRLGTSFNLFGGRVLFSSQVNYDLFNSLLQQHSHVFEYVSQCWTLRLEGREFKSLNDPEPIRDLRLALSLKNIGTFLDLNSSTRQDEGRGFF